MGKYVFAYHGGAAPDTTTEQERTAIMAAWESWMGEVGAALKDPGNPIMLAKTISADGTVTDGGGPNPLTGYSLVEANSLDGAVALAKGCPIFDSGGSIQVAEAIKM